MTMSAGNGGGTTGINPWWTYEEGSIPGAGKWLVNVASGNLIVQDEDVDIPERGIDLAFQRTYNSQSRHTYANGDSSTIDNYGNGWTNTFDAHISYNPNTGVMSVWDIDGAEYDFTASNGAWVAPPGLHGTTFWAGSGFMDTLIGHSRWLGRKVNHGRATAEVPARIQS